VSFFSSSLSLFLLLFLSGLALSSFRDPSFPPSLFNRPVLGVPNPLVNWLTNVVVIQAVNALEGRIFNGNAITAKFYDEERFEEGVYDG